MEEWPSHARTVLMSTPGEHQVTGGRMSQRMWRYLPPGQRRHLGRAALDDRVDAEPGERLPAPVEEDSVICGTAVDQFDHDALDLRPKGALAHLSTLPMQGDECVASIAASDLQIAHSQLRGFRHTRSGLVEEQQDRVFDPPVPRRAIGHVEQGVHLVHAQPGHRLCRCLFRRDGADLAVPCDMGGIATRDEACERPDRRQAQVARVCATAPLILEMIEEPPNQFRREVRDGQLSRVRRRRTGPAA